MFLSPLSLLSSWIATESNQGWLRFGDRGFSRRSVLQGWSLVVNALAGIRQRASKNPPAEPEDSRMLAGTLIDPPKLGGLVTVS
jgi:hypothetical protein